ncbi:MAG: class II aldolase/adducin family protein [Phycisphaeraceae bacterium]
MTPQQIKQQICDIGRRIWQRGLCAGNDGNISVRIDHGRLLCTPTGVSKGFITVDDLCLVDMAGNPIEPNPAGRNPTSELLLHLAIYKKRPDVKAVVHAHPPHAVAFAIANIALPQGVHPEAEVLLGRVPLARYATPGTQALSDRVIQMIGPDTNTVLMANHGSVSFCDDLLDAYHKLEVLDAYCHALLLAKSLGPPNTLTPYQRSDLMKIAYRKP